MKGSNGVLFATILIVAFVSLFGFGYSFYLFNCARLVSDERLTPGYSERIQKMNKTESMCDLHHQYSDPKDTMSEGAMFFGGTIIIDSVVLIAYGLSLKQKNRSFK